MSVTDLDTPPDAPEAVQPPTEPHQDAWKTSADGKEYVNKPGGARGVIWRREGETIEEAIARDARPKDKSPRRKSKKPGMPDPPRKADLKELEHELAEALKAPALLAASFGDEWAANHFTTTGPYLARNLIAASEHNPWLRRKLEEAATGQDAMMKVMGLVGVSGALFMYAIPPVIYWLNLPVPAKSREMFGIPPRREREAPYAVPTNGAAPAESFPA